MEMLFYKQEYDSTATARKKKLIEELDKLTEKEVTTINLEEWVSHFTEKYTLEVPILDEGRTEATVEPTKIDARSLPNRHFFDTSRPIMIDGTETSYFIPFTGIPELFFVKASTYTMNPPRGEVHGTELVLRFKRDDHDAEALKRNYESSLAEIKQHLEWLRSSLSGFNNGIAEIVRSRLEERKNKILKDQKMSGSLGVPLRRRDNISSYNYEIPRKKIVTRPQARPEYKGQPEPVVSMDQYNEILETLFNMNLMIERSPTAFEKMEEEHLRDHFLIHLNGKFEGNATGETFNVSGKTDILLKVDGKNVFIAECKFWHGGVGFKETIDQLLAYLSWRDTKTAVIMFNRNKNFSGVLEQIQELVKEHPNFKQDLGKTKETEFRFKMKHSADDERDLFLTVQVYNLSPK